MNPKLLGIIRHVLSAAGGLLVGLGIIEEGVVESLSGAILTILAFVASLKAPEKNVG